MRTTGEHPDPAQGDQGRLAPVRAQLLPPLPASGAPRGATRHIDQPSRVSLCRPRKQSATKSIRATRAREIPMRRRVTSILAASALVSSALWLVPGFAQTGLDRSVLPIREPKPPVITELDARKVKPPARFEVNAPKGAPNVLVILLDDYGYGASSTFGGPIPMPTADRLAYPRFALHSVPHDSHVCADARGAAERTQLALRQHGHDRRDGDSHARLYRRAPAGYRAAGRDAQAERLQHRALRQDA
ncbi:hypothetical protein ACVWW2_003470 [Bradyrhizobium sp. LM4.3]